jgi:GntR family transcriptional regulator
MLDKQRNGDIVSYTSNEPVKQRTKPLHGKEKRLNGILNDQSLIYEQIAQLIEDGILNGEYAEDGQVPSTNELAHVFGINPATAGKGVNRLAEEGLLYKKRGIGMFVAPGAGETLRRKRKEEFVTQAIETVLREAKKLGLTKAELLELLAAKADEEGLL